MKLRLNSMTQIAMLALMTFSLPTYASTHGWVNDGATIQGANKDGYACGGIIGKANRQKGFNRCRSASGWTLREKPRREDVETLTDEKNYKLLATFGRSDVGKVIFNETGVCFSCHGLSGNVREIPHYSSAAVARLNPQPSNLRDPQRLRLTTDAQRFRAIKYGIRGTAMVAMTHLSDAEIIDVLAYLETLRNDPLPGEMLHRIL